MTYDIISTGSKGNAVILNDAILIDCGVPFKVLHECYKQLKLVLLTHIHGDHFNQATVRKLAEMRPTLRFGCCEWLVPPLLERGVSKHNIDVYTVGENIVYPEFCTIKADRTIHNVQNCAYHIHQNGERILYATDTNSMSGVKALNYDLYMIEANYSHEEITERIRVKQAQGVYCHEWDALNNHLSREKATEWLYKNMGSNSQYIFVHEHID